MSGAIAAADARLAGLTATAHPGPRGPQPRGERLLVPLFGAVGLLFLIACANVSGLLLARGLQRQQEYATRAAIGAGRARLFRLVLIEAIVARADRGGARRRARLRHRRGAKASAVTPCRAPTPSVGWPVLLFGAGGGLVAGGRRRSAAGRARVAGQSVHAAQGHRGRRPAAASGACSAGSPPCRSCSRCRCWPAPRCSAHGPQPRSRPARLRDRAHPRDDRHPRRGPRQSRAFHEQALERVAAIPGVRHAAFAWGVPLTGNSWPAELEVVGRAAASSAIVDDQPAAAGGDRGLLRGDEHAPG